MLNSFINRFDKFTDKYGVWVFYIGLFLIIIGKYWFALGDDAPLGYRILRRGLQHAGYWLLIFRVLLFVPKYPLYVLCCVILFPIFKLSYNLGGWNLMLYSPVIIAASRDSDIKVVFRIFLLTFTLILISGPIAFAIGWFSDITKHKDILTAHSYGFTSPNTLACLMLMLVLLVLLYWDVKKAKVIATACCVTASLVGILTLGISVIFILLLTPLLYYFLKRYPIPAGYLTLLPWGCLLLSIILSFYYGPSYGATTFESRFSIPAFVYQNHGLSLFGQEYGYVNFNQAWKTGVQSLCIDNVYMHLVLCDGVVVALIVLLFLSHYLYRIGQMERPLLTSSVIGLFLIGLMEYVTLDASFNFLLLYYFHHFKPLSKSAGRYVAAAVAGLGLMALIFVLF